MTIKATALRDDIFEYLVENFSGEDELLTQFKAEAVEQGIPIISISPEQVKFLQFIIKASKVKSAIEVGTLFGYSAITIARALPEDGKLISLEIEPFRAEIARKNIEKAGLSHKIEVVEQKALEYIANLPEYYQVDFVFLDADKNNYYKYVKLLDKHIPIGGIISADNAFAFGFITSSAPERKPEDVKSIKSFNDFMNKWDKYFTTISPVGDGILLSLKIKD